MAELAKSHLSLKEEHLSLKEEHAALKKSHSAIGEVMKRLPPSVSEILQVAQIQTLLSDTSDAEMNKPLYLTLSESNTNAGQHFINYAGANFKLQWESTSRVSRKHFYKFTLSLEVPIKLTSCDVELCVSPYQEQGKHANLAKVCCFKDVSSDKSFHVVGSMDYRCKIETNLQIKIIFQRHHCQLCRWHMMEDDLMMKDALKND